jgi:hypothetical protein
MRSIRSTFLAVAALFLLGACADLPTAVSDAPPPGSDPAAGPFLSLEGEPTVSSDDYGMCGGTCLLPPVIVEGTPCYATVEDCPDGHLPEPEGGSDPGFTDDSGRGTGDDEPPADTCNTADPVMADEQVQAGLGTLWEASNADDKLLLRREQAGWIVQDTAGNLRVEQWSTSSTNFGCATIDVFLPTSGTVIGWVHTHPYAVDESIRNCEFQSVRYTGVPSNADRTAGQQLGAFAGLSQALPGYVIDKDGSYRFSGGQNTATPRGPRCGY